jgi:glutamate-ammonia-ligase adenylyltransferase
MGDDQAQLETALRTLPPPLVPAVERHWSAYCQALVEQGLDVTMDERRRVELCRVWACSEFVARSCIRYPQLLAGLIDSGDLDRCYDDGELGRRVHEAVVGVDDDDSLGQRLRYCRRREMVRIAWRDLTDRAELDETLNDTSLLADSCIDAALQHLEHWQRREQGVPTGADSNAAQGLVVLGMGKLGAHELNYSSDIDLIFAFPEAGETVGGPRAIANEQFFTALARRLIRLLDVATAHGFVYRVDMRLRPHGDSGPLVMNFDAMETYYQSQGRDWERYALIKARPVAGDVEQGRKLLAELRPFIYRRYLDYGTFEALRDMKTMINREVQKKGLQDNIKLGPGGIREIEFIGQLFQLIRGGREAALRQREIQAVLRALIDAGYLPDYVGRELLQDYQQLRRIENRLQAWADEQTHNLPAQDPAGELAWQRLALSLSPPVAPGTRADIDVGAMQQEISQIRRRVQHHFEQVFAAPQAMDAGPTEAADGDTDWLAVWLGTDDGELTGFADAEEARRRLQMLRESHACRALSAQGRARLDRLMPLVLAAVADVVNHEPVLSGNVSTDRTLHRVLTLLETIMRRTAYLALLIEHPLALSQLVKLCAASPWIAEHLSRYPLLLDELLDPRTLYAPLRREALAHELDAQLALNPDDDLEQQMDVLRHFKQAQVLRVAAADLVGAIPLMVVSDHLTWIAEVIVERVLHIAAVNVVPENERQAVMAGFAIIAYGKLGGFELGYASDLDLVFLHDGRHEAGTRYARLGQRVVHILTARTPAGILYDVDMRLRPSGASGLLVSSIDAFDKYQNNEAWTWEHQALLRARFVAGSDAIGARFDTVRHDVLARPRPAAALREEVRQMRERMRKELRQGGAGQFDLKQGPGGITDIEFIVQYAVLRWGGEYPQLLRWTDNIRQLEGLADTGLMSDRDCRLLTDAYQAYRACAHRLALQQLSTLVADDEFSEFRHEVMTIWSRLFDSADA